MPDPRILVGLDFPTAERADALVSRLRPELCALKVGKELFTAAGPDFVRSVVARGFRVFLDLKFHDIPNTVAQACVAATRLGVWMLDVHASGGRSMMAAARAAVEKEAARQGIARPLLVGVTVLTSLSAAELGEVGVSAPPGEQALRLAVLSQASGLDGVVCSPREIQLVRKVVEPRFKIVTPGIRLPDQSLNDQQRIATPREALSSGADYIVVGRAITDNADPRSALQRLLETIM